MSWVTYVMFALAFGAPAISWIAQKLKEQHDVKQERMRIREAEDEALRTGQIAERRAEPEPQTPAGRSQQQLQDLAARRKAQLEALRARQRETQQGGHDASGAADRYDVSEEERAREREAAARRAERARTFLQGPGGQQPPTRTGTGGGAAAPPPIRTPSGTVVRVPQQPPRRRSTQADRVVARPQRSGQGSPQRGQAGGRPGQGRQQTQRPAQMRGDDIAALRVTGPAIAETEGQVVPIGGAARRVNIGRDVRAMFLDERGRPRGRSDLIKLIAAAEVLGKPMSLRERVPGDTDG